MTRQATRMQVFLARLAGALVIAFALVGFLIYGASGEVWQRILLAIEERPGGPLTFRFILQPTMATILAAIDGVRDARSGAPPYFWSLITGSKPRGDRLFDGFIATSRVVLLGLGMDIAYQIMQNGKLYPGEAAIVAVLLAFIPYLLLRGPFARLAKIWFASSAETNREQ